MKRWIVCVLVVVWALLSFCGCRVNDRKPVSDPTPPPLEDGVVAVVNGVKITKERLILEVDRMVRYSGLTEYDWDADEAEYKEDLIQSAYTTLIDVELCRQAAQQAGALTVTEADRQSLTKEMEESIKDGVDAWVEKIKGEYPDKTDEEIRLIARDEYCASLGYTYEEMLEERILYWGLAQYQQMVFDTVTVTEEQLKEKYETLKSEQKTSYTEDTSAFEDAMDDGTVVCWYPAGYVRVLSLLIQMDSEDSDKITELYYADEVDEKAIQAARDAGLKKIKAKAEKVLKKAQAKGVDFAALIAEYGEDPGMSTEENREKGYLVGRDAEGWDPDFQTAVTALEKVGDITGLVASDYGYFIIQLKEILPEGDVPLATVHDALKESYLLELQQTTWNEHLEALSDASQIEENEELPDLSEYFDSLKADDAEEVGIIE